MSDQRQEGGTAMAEGMLTWKDRIRLWLPELGIRHPWWTVGATVVLAAGFLAQFPKVKFDNDPENMLADDEPVRVFNRDIKAKYALYDFVIVGVVNTNHADGVFNVTTLNRLDRLTRELLSLRQGPDGLPVVSRLDGEGNPKDVALDLRPQGWWSRLLATAFNQNANHLFRPDGSSAIIGHELIGPSVVDNIKQAELGSLKMEYLMEQPPRTREEALAIRADAMGNPLYNGTLVAEDEKAICLYIPIVEKRYSYNVARLVEELARDWEGDDRLMITGQPVAQDTFGVQMLVQMATSAPLAALAIFLLMYLFFRRIPLIVAPMLVAILSVVATMGLLIGLGYDVHIMSSMIAIFLMPISVADSVHILSEFFDSYAKFNDKAKTVRHVMRHLFMPMLYTSLTTIAGFASLATTPIPPVKVFGLHVAFGVTLAWVLTMVFVPAYIMVGVSRKTLEKMASDRAKREGGQVQGSDSTGRFLDRIGVFAASKPWPILTSVVLLVVFAVWGVLKIRVNDNPVKWFTKAHPIRIADETLNHHFGGTYTAYLTFEAVQPDAVDCRSKAATMAARAKERFGLALPEATERFVAMLGGVSDRFQNVFTADLNRCFVNLVEEAGKLDAEAVAGWNRLADAVNYLDSEGLTRTSLLASLVADAAVDAKTRGLFADRVKALPEGLSGAGLQEAALAICDGFTALSFKDFVFEQQAELSAPLFKRPEMLRYLEGLQRHLQRSPVVGKTSSAVDALVKGAFELAFVEPPADATDAERTEFASRNEANRSVPATAAAVGQVFTQLEGMKRRDALFHMVTRDYQQANVWVQLKSGDNVDMETVVADAEAYLRDSPPPVPLKAGWSGMTYINVVWQDKMVSGMFGSLASSFVVVLVMMVVLFRSVLFGVLSMIPLSVTILVTYGLIGWVGKDYDMPIAVLSALTLGLSVDFAIHFLERAREEAVAKGSWKLAAASMFREPAMAISRNAITIAVGFTPLLAAPLVPYKTVGFFLAAIMTLSWIATLIVLPPLLTLFQRRAFPSPPASTAASTHPGETP